MRNFIGRQTYLKQLDSLWRENQTRLISLYGRRRVGKSELIRVFAKGKTALIFEAIEGEGTPEQIKHFLTQMSQIFDEPHLKDLIYHDWSPVFELLSQKIAKSKTLLICFDELPWMAAGRSKLVSYIKYYWDTRWKQHPHLMLILCGSIASWMVQNIVRSKALYGRISENILVNPLKPFEVAEFIGSKRGRQETLEYLLCFGGIPRYLEEFDFNRSLQLNIEKTCFQRSGFFVDEADKIFYNQFKETRLYKMIAAHLLRGPSDLAQIAKRIKMPSGGGLKQYLDNLIAAGIIEKAVDLRHFHLSKSFRYHMTDEFLRFHARFIQPHMDEIAHSETKNRFEKFTNGQWQAFLGYAFERFCLKNRYAIADILNFGQKVTSCGSLCNLKKGYQYDLIFLRNDGVISVCEVKYLSGPASTSLIKEMEQRLSKTNFPASATIERILITNRTPSTALTQSSYFHHILTATEIVEHEMK